MFRYRRVETEWWVSSWRTCLQVPLLIYLFPMLMVLLNEMRNSNFRGQITLLNVPRTFL